MCSRLQGEHGEQLRERRYLVGRDLQMSMESQKEGEDPGGGVFRARWDCMYVIIRLDDETKIWEPVQRQALTS